MVLFYLYVKADLEGVASMALSPGANICISVRNPLDNLEVREKVVVHTNELVEPLQVEKQHHKHRDHEHHHERPCHFALKWDKHDQTRSTIEILDNQSSTILQSKNKKKGKYVILPREILAEDSGNFVPMLVLECQGLEPYAFHPMENEFVVISSKSGTKFEKVDLSQGAWGDYDLSSGCTEITNFEAKFVTI